MFGFIENTNILTARSLHACLFKDKIGSGDVCTFLDYLAAKVLWELSVQLKTVVTETPFHDVL